MNLRLFIVALGLLAVPASAQLSTATPAQIRFQQTDTSDTRLRKLEIVRKAVAAGGGAVTSFNTRTGAVSLTSGDVTTALTFTPLRPSNNLSDLASASTARTNLGLGIFATSTDAANLTGTIGVARLPIFTSGAAGAVSASGGGTTNFLRADGSWAIPAGTTTANALTFNTSGGAAAGTTFNGSVARTVDYSTVGAQPLNANLTSLAAVNWGSGVIVPVLTATNTYGLRGVGAIAGNILDRAAGDSLYSVLGHTHSVFTSGADGFAPASGGGTTNFLRADGSWVAPPGGGGGTTTNPLTMNNGGSGAASGSTFNGSAAITLSYNTLGAAPLASPTFTGKVTTAASATGGAGFNLPHGTAPSSPANGDLWTTTSGLFGQINSATKQFATGSGTASGTNTGDQTITLTGDVTGSGTGSFAATLATVNSNVGTFGDATHVAQVTVNGKGLVTAASSVTISGSNPWTEKVLTSDFTNATVSANLITDGTNALSFTPPANSNWEAEAVLLIQTATITVGPRVGVSVAAQGTGSYGSSLIETTGATATTFAATFAGWTTAAGGAASTIGDWPTASVPFVVRVTIRGHSGASPALIQLTLASETAATTVTAKAGSLLRTKSS